MTNADNPLGEPHPGDWSAPAAPDLPSVPDVSEAVTSAPSWPASPVPDAPATVAGYDVPAMPAAPAMLAAEEMPAMSEVPGVPSYTPPAAAPVSTPSSVLIDANASSPKRKKNVLPWALAGVATLGAGAFGVLWSGKSGEASDLKDDKTALIEEVDGLEGDLSSAQDAVDQAAADAEEAQATIDGLNADLADAEGNADALQTEIDGLEATIEELQAQPTNELSDASALTIGRAVGSTAQPPLTDDEARCLGREISENLDYETLALVSFAESPDSVSDGLLDRFGRGLIRSLDDCSITFERVNP